MEHRINQDEIARLLEFLPIFENPQYQFVSQWQDFYPVYLPDVYRFFRLVSQLRCFDSNYTDRQARKIISSIDSIQTASLNEVCDALTFCARGERFCYGYWNSVLQSGKLVSILKRLQIIQKLNKPKSGGC